LVETISDPFTVSGTEEYLDTQNKNRRVCKYINTKV